MITLDDVKHADRRVGLRAVAISCAKQNGYEIFGELPDFPTGHTRFFMTKRL